MGTAKKEMIRAPQNEPNKKIKHYCAPLFESDMDALRELVGEGTTCQQALEAAVEYALTGMISAAELEKMAENEKRMR